MIIALFVVTGNSKLVNKQDERVSWSFPTEEESSVHPSNILVHFECGEFEFPMRITANNFDQFYAKVASAVQSKVSDFKSCCMQFQCGKKWYKFNQHTGFDSLCLNKDDPEIAIQVVTMSSKLKHLGKY